MRYALDSMINILYNFIKPEYLTEDTSNPVFIWMLQM